MVKSLKIALALLCLLLNPILSATPDTPEAAPRDPIAITLVAENTTIAAGEPFWVAIHVDLDPHWHAYWINPGDAGMAPDITWTLPSGFTTGTTLWPTPKRFDLGSMVGFGYEGAFTLLAEIIPPTKLPLQSLDLAADIRWLVCSDSSCLPGDSSVAAKVKASTTTPVANEKYASLFTDARASIPKQKTGITAKRNDDLIELSFTEPSFIKKADFFPEDNSAIDASKEPLFETQPNAEHQHTLVVRELNPNKNLKGILVLNTADGDRAYDLNLAIADPDPTPDIVMNTPPQKPINSDLFTSANDNSFDFEGGVILAIALAFVGGLLLNLMPCVLPVISFKVMSFIKLSGQSRKLIFQHGMAFTFGVLLSFWILAALLLTLQTYGRAVGWGFQLQEPIFVASLAALIFIFSLSLFGVFEMGTSLISAAGQATHAAKDRNALVGSFLSGILATAVATPCTGPFLGSAVGFAVTLPPAQAMLIFTSLGLGMSLPYLLFAAFPSLLRFMPKPGPWMITFKELMGFLMLATVVWLVWVFSAQTSSLAVSVLLSAFFLMSVAAWVYGKWATPLKSKVSRLFGSSSALIFFALGCYLLVFASTSLESEQTTGTSSTLSLGNIADAWEEFSPERVAELQAKGIPVFVDFTSKWCLICQANHLVLTLEDVAKAFAEQGVVKMKADWTKRDAVITAELKKFGRNSVPLYVLYGKDASTAPQILPQVLTPEAVIMSLTDLQSGSTVAEK